MSVEKKIARRFIEDALAVDCAITVNDGGADVLLKSKSVNDILATMFSTDEDCLYVYKDGEMLGWVHFVHGNGVDVIADYTVSLDSIIRGANNLADTLS